MKVIYEFLAVDAAWGFMRECSVSDRGQVDRGLQSRTLHARIAEALGWSEEEARGFSLLTLREMVRERRPKLAAEITERLRTADVLLQKGGGS